MTFLNYVQFLRRWMWLAILGAVVAGSTSYFVSLQMPKLYEARTKLLLTPAQPGSSVTASDLTAAERLAGTYSELIKTRPVVQAGIEQAGLAVSYESALGLINVSPVRNTQLLQISAQAGNPEAAARLANSVADALIQQVQSNQANRFATGKESLRKQIEQIAADVAEDNRQLDLLRREQAGFERDDNIARLQLQLAQLQQSYGSALRDYEDLRLAEARAADVLAVVDSAVPSATPVQPRVLMNVLSAMLFGLLLAAAVAFVLERLDDRVTSPERLARFGRLRALGSVELLPAGVPHVLGGGAAAPPTLLPAAGGRRRPKKSAEREFVEPAPALPASSWRLGLRAVPRRLLERPRAWWGQAGFATNERLAVDAWQQKLSESLHLLQANLEFVSVERTPVTILVTSAEAGEGKTTLASNLAVVAAQAGRDVVLVDADLRRPGLHKVFGVRNRSGLTSLLRDPTVAPGAVLQRTRVTRLRVLTSGPVPPNPTELLASERLRVCLRELRTQADLVVLDAPGVLVASDAPVLTGQVDGTLLVVNAQRTAGQRVSQAVAVLQHAGAHLLGGVLNCAPRHAVPSYTYAADAEDQDQALPLAEGGPISLEPDRAPGTEPNPPSAELPWPRPAAGHARPRARRAASSQ
jgi:capsular exopolysaccharide synthesis family protein